MRVINQCQIDYTMESDKRPIIRESKISNEVVSEIIEQLIKVDKKVDKNNALEYDILTYNITITNIGLKTVSNIYFFDELPSNVQYIYNTVKINGVLYNCVTPAEGFKLSDLPTGKVIYVSFQAVVEPSNLEEINNQASVVYDYTYNIKEAPLRIQVKSNNVTTNIEKALFKQFQVQHALSLYAVGKEQIDLEDIQIKLDIYGTKLISKWPEGDMRQVIYDTSTAFYNLLVIGKVTYTLQYHHVLLKKTSQPIESKMNVKEKAIYHDTRFGRSIPRQSRNNISKKYSKAQPQIPLVEEKIVEVYDNQAKEKQIVMGFTTYLKVPLGIKYSEDLPIQVQLEDSSWQLRPSGQIDVYLTCIVSF